MTRFQTENQRTRASHSWQMILVLLAFCFVAMAPVFQVAGQTAETDGTDLKVQIGFDGKLKLGSWSPVFLQYPPSLKPTRFEIESLDGNGLPVRCGGPLTGQAPGSAQGWVRLGKQSGSVTVAILDEAGNSICSKEITPDKILDSTIPLLLTIEPEDEVAKNLKTIESQLFATKCEVVPVNETRNLPASPLGYQGVRAIYLSTSAPELIESITDEQWLALESWVATGGKLVIGIGKNAERFLTASSPLTNLLPGKLAGQFEIKKSFRLETYTRIKKQQLLKRGDPPIIAAKVTEPVGIVDLTVDGNPLVIRKPHRFGQIVLSAIDFDTKPLSVWAGQKNYLMKLTFDQLNLNRTLTGESESRSVLKRGHKDILGQLVFPLEKFSQVRFINFTIVAVLIGLFILCIGPGDFFLLRKLFGRMEWTWITFSLLALSFCGLAMFLSRSTKPSSSQINQLEIIDIDAESNTIRGNIWTNIYSPFNATCKVSPPPSNSFGIDTSSTNISWMGLPGDGLGGMRSNSQLGLSRQGYECQMETSGPNKQSVASSLTMLPVKVASTKTLYSQYDANHDFGIRSRLRLNSRGRLQGTITNPFDQTLKECRVLFENWAYVVGSPIEPGDSVEVLSEMRERTTSSYFSRRVDTESDKGGGLPWRPQEDDIGRIAEMMMFFEAASGPSYTGLSHGFQPFVDLSEQLNLRRAVLFARIDSAGTELDIQCSSSDVEYDQSRTYVRIVLPVK